MQEGNGFKRSKNQYMVPNLKLIIRPGLKNPEVNVRTQNQRNRKDVAWLLRSIRSTYHRIEETKYLHAMLLENRKHFYDCK